MKLVLISDSHVRKNINTIYTYLKNKTWNIDAILINGDILGENELTDKYGFNYNRKILLTMINRDEILKSITQDYEILLKLRNYYESANKDGEKELEFSKFIKKYVESRYTQLFDILKKFSTIAKTYFNIGTYESPLLYKVLTELAFLIEVPETFLRSIALLSNYRNTFKTFQTKFKEEKNLKYIGGSTIIIKDLMIAAIPGLNESSAGENSMAEFQEKMATDLLNTVTRQLSHVNKLIILNQSQGKLRKDPFAFRPGSMAVRKFIESTKGKLKHKLFIQSYHHFMTTHYYKASEFYFILNNAAVNNSLFNLIEITQRISCFDIDPNLDIVRQLDPYNYNLSDYDTPNQRLALNYQDSEEIIKQRNLEGCYYM